MTSSLYINKNDHSVLTIPEYEYVPLNPEAQEQRFIIVQPCSGNLDDIANHVRCSIVTKPLSDNTSFIAVKNSRGYRFFKDVIEVDGKALIVSVAIEKFLRHIRLPDRAITLWIRHVCLIEYDKTEQSLYWTRPFIDSMYECAESVIDLSLFNMDLLDNGTIRPINQQGYGEWTKVWTGMDTQTTPLPQVFPIRIGQNPSVDNPTSRFAYVPLDMIAQEIRLVMLIGNADPDAPILIHLAHCPYKSEVKYTALSYTWGNSEPTTDIIVNGQLLNVRENLAGILRAVRRPSENLVLWIDAICIDQQNIIERNHVLPQMAKIYDTAVSVLAYIGPSTDDNNATLEFLEHMQGAHIYSYMYPGQEMSDEAMNSVQHMHGQLMLAMHRNEDGSWIIGRNTKEHLRPDEYLPLCAALYKLLTRPYFRRVWILQEIAFASNPTLGYGSNFELALERLHNAA